MKLCKCNNCGNIYEDMNPQSNAPEYAARPVPQLEWLRNADEDYWGCPKCQTDEYLSDSVLMPITRTSVASGITRTIEMDVTPEQLARIEGTEHIQHVLPHLSADEREFILTGITGEEWDELFKEEDEE